MGKRISNVLWGLIFIAIGIGVAGSMAGLWELYPFFNGWWTLLIIVPAVTSVIGNGLRIANTVCLVVGLALLACCRGYLPWEAMYQLLVPVVFIVIGCVMVVKNLFHLGERKVQVPNDRRREELVVFSGKKLIINGEFYGIDGDAVFGGLTIDLRNAEISQNISIDVMAVFGGVEVLLPDNVLLNLSDTSMFGGCSNNRKQYPADGPVVYVNAVALFGGVEVK